MEERTDLISRQAAIETVCYNCTEKGICNGICDDTDRLRDLPTIEPKHGKWIFRNFESPYIWGCSECGDHVRARYNFCPNCGSRMDGE